MMFCFGLHPVDAGVYTDAVQHKRSSKKSKRKKKKTTKKKREQGEECRGKAYGQAPEYAFMDEMC